MNARDDQRNLSKEIERLRNEMELLAIKKGFSHHDTVLLSQKLDEMMNRYTKKKTIKK